MDLARKAAAAWLLCLLLCVSVSARAQTEITGPDSALVADFVQLEISIPGQEYSKVSFNLFFDTNQVQLLGLSAPQGWELTILGQAVTLERGDGAGTDIHLQLRLRILPVPAQTKIRVAVSDVTGYREGEQTLLGDASHEMTVTEPLSSDNFLTELSIEEGTLAPAFHRDVTQYTATVPAYCSQPRVHTVGADKSRVEVTQTAFDENRTCLVTVTVTAENGSQRVYAVTVTREEAPPAESTAPATETSAVATEDTVQTGPQAQQPAQEGLPGWLLVVALLAGAALGGAGAILLNETRKKDR